MKDTKRILIVEDEARVAFFLQESLESLDKGYKVVRAASGEDALHELTQSPFDLVVSDLRMPGINGLELLQRVREQSPSTQTILITAYGSDEVEAASRRLQTCRYFTKPFRIEDFTLAVKQVLEDNVLKRMPAMAALSGERFDKSMQRLADLRYEVGAQVIFLFDGSGRVLAEVGFAESLQPDTIVPLVGSGFAHVGDLASSLHEERAFNLHYHEGTRYDVYTANVGEQLFLTLVFDRRQGASRVGMVWLYTKRAVQDLLYLIANEGALPLDESAAWNDYGWPLRS